MSEVKNLHGAPGIEKLKELAEKEKTVMLISKVNSYPLGACPMYIQQVEEDGTFWFFSDKSSEHNANIKADPRVQILNVNTGDSSYYSIAGKAEVLYDRQKAEELWNVMAKVWFQDGVDDPKLTLIRFTPEMGYYWDTKTNRMIEFLKMASSIVTGKTTDDAIMGKLEVG